MIHVSVKYHLDVILETSNQFYINLNSFFFFRMLFILIYYYHHKVCGDM